MWGVQQAETLEICLPSEPSLPLLFLGLPTPPLPVGPAQHSYISTALYMESNSQKISFCFCYALKLFSSSLGIEGGLRLLVCLSILVILKGTWTYSLMAVTHWIVLKNKPQRQRKNKTSDNWNWNVVAASKHTNIGWGVFPVKHMLKLILVQRNIFLEMAGKGGNGVMFNSWRSLAYWIWSFGRDQKHSVSFLALLSTQSFHNCSAILIFCNRVAKYAIAQVK